MQSRFNVKILESVSNELNFLPEKARDKILFNILKSTKVLDADLLKNLQLTSGNFGLTIQILTADC